MKRRGEKQTKADSGRNSTKANEREIGRSAGFYGLGRLSESEAGARGCMSKAESIGRMDNERWRVETGREMAKNVINTNLSGGQI